MQYNIRRHKSIGVNTINFTPLSLHPYNLQNQEEQHIDNNDILHFLQHLNKVDAGQISQERQHEQNNIMVTA